MSFNSRMGVAILLALSIFACSGSAQTEEGFLDLQQLDVAQIEAISSRSLLQDATGSYGSYAPSYAPTYYSYAPAYGGYEGGYAPAYYYTAPAAYGGYEPAPTYYYYSAPSPAAYGGYEPAAPTYYYYAAPSPAAYGGYEPAPTYFYYPAPTPVAPGGYAPAAPTYYYTVPVAPGGYAPSAPAYYYTAPGSYAPTYYYASPGGYTAPGGYAAPTYYYVAPAPAPASECPACPVCPTDSAPGRRLTAQAITPAVRSLPAPAGTCYCPYDLEWKSWAISLKSCRDSLYTRCDADSRLDCKWLDEYFNPGSASGFMKAHEKDISEYLYQDCPPAAPCACAALNFDKRDEGSAVYSCCRDLAIWAQVPHSGISQKEVDAFCKAGKSDKVAAWVKHSLWHEVCEEPRPVYYATRAIEAKVVENVEDAPVAKAAVAEAAQPAAAAVAEEPRIEYVRTTPEAGTTIAAPVLVAAIVGLCAFVAVLGGVLGFHYARNAQQL